MQQGRQQFGVFLIFLLCLGQSLMARAESPQPPTTERKALLMTMHDFYGSLLQLKPYLVNYDEFKKPENKEKVSGLLNELEKKISQNKPATIESSSDFSVTYDVLSRHLRDINKLYNRGIYDPAWRGLNATTNFCISCHNRLPKEINSAAFNWASKQGLVDTKGSLQDAEFFYIAHNFDHAMEIYNGLIRNYKAGTDLDLLKIYERKLAYFTRVLRNPNLALKSLKEDQANKNLPAEIKEDLKTWIQFFQSWKAEGKKDPAKFSDGDLVRYSAALIDKHAGGQGMTIANPSALVLLRVSGLLYERVFAESKSDFTAEMLYQLARCERELRSVRLYSLADIYLRECVTKYPKNPIAKKCLQDYEISLKSYPNVDREFIQSNIDSLRKLIEAH